MAASPLLIPRFIGTGFNRRCSKITAQTDGSIFTATSPAFSRFGLAIHEAAVRILRGIAIRARPHLISKPYDEFIGY
jgi:hypothetical protein